MSISMSYLYHILYNTLIFNMVYFRGSEVKIAEYTINQNKRAVD